MKSKAFDVAEKYFKPKAEAAELQSTDDPLVTVEVWYPVFRDLHHKVIAEACNLDYNRLRMENPDLYRQIKITESRIDDLGDARLSDITVIMGDWRRLVLKAELARRVVDEHRDNRQYCPVFNEDDEGKPMSDDNVELTEREWERSDCLKQIK